MSIHAEHEQTTVLCMYQKRKHLQNNKKNTPLSIVSVHESIGVVGDIRKFSLSFEIARLQCFKGFN